jgi:hypothetical protein
MPDISHNPGASSGRTPLTKTMDELQALADEG